MTSVKAKWDDKTPGLPTFNATLTVNGQLLYLIGPSEHLPEIPPGIIYIYLHKPDYAE